LNIFITTGSSVFSEQDFISLRFLFVIAISETKLNYVY